LLFKSCYFSRLNLSVPLPFVQLWISRFVICSLERIRTFFQWEEELTPSFTFLKRESTTEELGGNVLFFWTWSTLNVSMNSVVIRDQETIKLQNKLSLDKSLNSAKGSRRGNSGNSLELHVLTTLHHVPWLVARRKGEKVSLCQSDLSHHTHTWSTILNTKCRKSCSVDKVRHYYSNKDKMVQGEKTSMFTASSCGARTSDPFARKAGFEAMQRMDKSSGSSFSGSSSSASSSFSSSSSSNNATSNKNYGSWGPTFQNKQNFASMHWC